MRGAGLNPGKELASAIAENNATLKEVPRGKVLVALHVCLGNSLGCRYTEGGDHPVAKELFPRLDGDGVPVLIRQRSRWRFCSFCALVLRGKDLCAGPGDDQTMEAGIARRSLAAALTKQRATSRWRIWR